MKKNVLYLILTPPPNAKSAGVTYLNNLGGYLKSIGKNAINIFHAEDADNLYIWNSSSIPLKSHWVTPWQGAWVPWSQDVIKRTFSDFSIILIHGENKHCKYFNEMNVVRYYLAAIGQLRKIGVPREGEFKLAWDKAFCDNPNSILQKSTFRGDLNAAVDLSMGNRGIDLTYVGKGHLWRSSTPRLDNTIELTRSWPANDDEYFYLLSKTRFIYTYDHITSVVEDAVIFGAFPIFIDQSLKNNKSWLESINKRDFYDCYSFLGDSLDMYMENFMPARARFISGLKMREAEYFSKLSEVCLRIERYFNLL